MFVEYVKLSRSSNTNVEENGRSEENIISELEGFSVQKIIRLKPGKVTTFHP